MTQPLPTNKQRRIQARGNWQVTERDLEILEWVGRHGVVTADQITRGFFKSPRTAYNRIRKLVEMALLRRDRWYWNSPWLIRVTYQGARLTDLAVRPAALVHAQVPHGLAVVDLMSELASTHPDAELITERELRARRRDSSHEIGRGRIPDGALKFPDGRVIGIELDRTPKRSRQYAPLIRAYGGEGLSGIWWFTPNDVTSERLRSLTKREYLDDLIKVYTWPR